MLTTISARCVDEAFDKIKEIYHSEDICLSELLSTISVTGISINDVVETYANLFYSVEHDEVTHIKEGDPVLLRSEKGAYLP